MKRTAFGLFLLFLCCTSFSDAAIGRFSVLPSSPPDSLIFDSIRGYNQLVLNDSLLKYYVVEDSATYTYEMILDDLQYFAEQWPDAVHPVKVGDSEFGLDLPTVRIGRKKRNANTVLLIGNIHAREDFSSKLLMKFLNVYLLSIDGKSNVYPRAAALLDSLDIYIVPVANPDGLKIAQGDLIGIRDSVTKYKDSIFVVETIDVWKANGKGIDINMTFDDGNFYVKKGGVFQPIPASEGYKGTAPAQPKETQAIQRMVQIIQPLVTASFHTKGNILFWADFKTHAIFNNIDTKITKKVVAASGYQMSGIAKNPADFGCGLENYVRSRLGLIGTCIEVSYGDSSREQHEDSKFNKEVWTRAWNIPFIYIESAVKYGPQIRENSAGYLMGLHGDY